MIIAITVKSVAVLRVITTAIRKNKMTFTNALSPSTPCLICEKALMYIELGENKTKDTDVINNGTNFQIVGNYGSEFDSNIYEAVICDECLDKAIQRRRVDFVRNYEEGE
jgi:hypothetical protein